MKTFDISYSTDGGSTFTTPVSAASLGMADWTIGATTNTVSTVEGRTFNTTLTGVTRYPVQQPAKLWFYRLLHACRNSFRGSSRPPAGPVDAERVHGGCLSGGGARRRDFDLDHHGHTEGLRRDSGGKRRCHPCQHLGSRSAGHRPVQHADHQWSRRGDLHGHLRLPRHRGVHRHLRDRQRGGHGYRQRGLPSACRGCRPICSVGLADSVPANGVTTSTITVTVKNAGGLPLPGKLVSLSGDGSATIDPAGAGTDTTNASGVATFTVKSGAPGSRDLHRHQ